MTNFVLWGAGIMMLIPGLIYLFAPQKMLDTPGIVLKSTDEHHSTRAAYGGGFLGIAALFIWSALHPEDHRMGLIAVVLLLGGFALGRIYSIIVDGKPHNMFLGVLGAEILFVVLALTQLF